MRIAYIGNFGPSFSTETHLRLTLESMGHEVTPIQENQHNAHDATKLARGADLLLWTRTWGVKGDAAKMLRDFPRPTVAYHLDLYAGLQREDLVRTDPWWRCRYVFTPDGGSDAFWQKHGVNHVYMKPGVFAPECYLTEPEVELACCVAFVGSYGYHPEWPYRPKLIDWLQETYGARFAHFGNGPHTAQSCIRGHELNQLYASATVVVGDSLCLGFAHARYWSDRVYETLGRGGFLIHPRIVGLEEEFTDGEHLRLYNYNDFDELRRLIDHYLAHDDEREAIRQAGHAKVKADCTYHQRMTSMLEHVAKGEG